MTEKTCPKCKGPSIESLGSLYCMNCRSSPTESVKKSRLENIVIPDGQEEDKTWLKAVKSNTKVEAQLNAILRKDEKGKKLLVREPRVKKRDKYVESEPEILYCSKCSRPLVLAPLSPGSPDGEYVCPECGAVYGAPVGFSPDSKDTPTPKPPVCICGYRSEKPYSFYVEENWVVVAKCNNKDCRYDRRFRDGKWSGVTLGKKVVGEKTAENKRLDTVLETNDWNTGVKGQENT